MQHCSPASLCVCAVQMTGASMCTWLDPNTNPGTHSYMDGHRMVAWLGSWRRGSQVSCWEQAEPQQAPPPSVIYAEADGGGRRAPTEPLRLSCQAAHSRTLHVWSLLLPAACEQPGSLNSRDQVIVRTEHHMSKEERRRPPSPTKPTNWPVSWGLRTPA